MEELSQIVNASDNFTPSTQHLASMMKTKAEKSVSNLQQTMLNLELIRAIHRRDVFGENGVRALLKRGASLKQLDLLEGETPIHVALSVKVASEIHLPMIKMLAENGASCSIADRFGWTPLMIAVRSGSMPLIMIIFRHGDRTNLGAVNQIKESCLHIACHVRAYEIVRFLVARSSEYGIGRQNINGKTALHIAAQNGSTKIIQVLRKKDCREVTLMQLDNRGWTALHWAIFAGHVNAIRLLLKLGMKDLSEEETNRLEKLGEERASSYVESGTVMMATAEERIEAKNYVRKRRIMRRRKKELFDLPPDPPPLETEEKEEKENEVKGGGVAYQRTKQKNYQQKK